MQTTLLRFLPFGKCHSTVRRRLGLGLVALILVATVVAAGLDALRVRRQESLAAQAFAVSSRAIVERCVDGAVLFNDVRWAVVCQAQADKGQGDGFADCELPDTLSAPLYASLQQEERKCAAEATASRVQ
jgi:hypothetical protein